MKALPKLSKAQQEVWARILEWRSTYRLARSFRAGGTAGWQGNLENRIATSDATLKALTRKGLLISAGEKFGFNRYMVNPDYLPDSEPAAEPESEPVAVEYEVGDKVVPNYGMWKNAVCTVDEKYWDQGGVTRYVLKNAVGQIGIIRYKADELEPAASEPATDDRETTSEIPFDDQQVIYDAIQQMLSEVYLNPLLGKYHSVTLKDEITKHLGLIQGDHDDARPVLDAERAVVLDAMMASYDDRVATLEMERDIARNENAKLTSQLEALRVRFAELEAENASLQRQNGDVLSVVNELEAENGKLNGHIVKVEKARDFWRAKYNQWFDEKL